MTNQNKPILFFDGVCNLCNGFVDFLLKVGCAKRFQFASLQGETAKKLIPAEKLQSLDSVIYYSDSILLERSSAILAIAAKLPLPWRLLVVFKLLPTAFRDSIYDFIARRRYSIFGKREYCRLPTSEERDFFLP